MNDLNEDPINLLLSASSFEENIADASTIATLSSTDPDSSDTHTYSLVDGDGDTDNNAFTIVGDQLQINASPDYETKNSYSVRLQTKDSGGLTFEKAFTLSVNDLNEDPINLLLSASSFEENIADASTIATLSSTDPDSSDTFTYSLVSGTGDTNNSAFTIEGDQLKIVDSPDFETRSSYSIRLQTTDSGGLTCEESFTLRVNNINESPTALAVSTSDFNENISGGSVVATLISSDIDASDSHTYSLVSGVGATDNSAFTIDGNQLKILSSPDFETKSSYSIRLQTTDSGGLTFEESFTLRVNDENEDPTDLFVSASSFDENIEDDSAVLTLSATDQDFGDAHTYSLISGGGDTDNSAFTIDGDQLKINASPDYETQDSYSIRLRTTDSSGLTCEKAFVLTVNDLKEVPDLDEDGFVDETTNYQMWTPSGGVHLMNRRGKTFSDSTSRMWNAEKAVQVDSDFSILIKHERKDEKYKIWSSNSDGVITKMSKWKSGDQMLSEGYEDLFELDLNGDSIIGKPPIQDLDGDGFVDNVSNYQVYTTDDREVYLRNKNGRRIFSDDTSSQWDAVKVITTDSAINALIEGSSRKDGKFKVWNSDLYSGNLRSQSKWKTEQAMMNMGYESIFNYDINDNGVVGY